jgi:hypothetical protein
MDACTAELLHGVTMLRQCPHTALQLLYVLAEGGDAAVELGEVLVQRPKATRGARQGLLQHYGRYQHAEKPCAATNAQPKRLWMLFPPLEENGPIDLLQLSREGRPLSWAPSAHAVAGNEAMEEDQPKQQQKQDATDLKRL